MHVKGDANKFDKCSWYIIRIFSLGILSEPVEQSDCNPLISRKTHHNLNVKNQIINLSPHRTE